LQSVITHSEDETAALGRKLGSLLRAGDFVALNGELGSGKTRFVQGVAAGLQVEPGQPVTSPTYSLLHIHNGRLPLYHFDLYRLSSGEEIELLGFSEYFYGEGVSIVEWADRLRSEMPEECLNLVFSYLGEEERRIDFVASGNRYEELMMNLFP
jgi:tRNA threonylcarbamoyladenosine biosynthesis protein TsaE